MTRNDEAKQSHSRSEGSRCPTCGSTIKSFYRRPCDTENNAADPWHEAESPPAEEVLCHIAILSPPLEWGPEEFRDRHLSGEQDGKEKWDPRCPKCVQDWARTGKEHAK